MKQKERKELKNKSVGELERLVRESNDRLRALHFELAAGKVKDVRSLREVKKKVARMKTFLKQANG